MRNLPPLRLLAVFDAVVRTGGVGQAAPHLNVTQPAVSQALNQLEQRLETRLFERRRRPAELTEAGRILFAAVQEGLSRITDAIDEIARLASAAQGTVTIACSAGFATYWLMPRLAGFYIAEPDIAVNVMTTPQGAPRLAAGIDIAVRYGGGDWSDGAVVPLFAERVDPVCSPGYLASIRARGADLGAATLLHVDVDDEPWVRWPEYLKRQGLAAGGRQARHFTNYIQATQAAVNGQGVMLGWRSITGDLVEEGRLLPVLDAPLFPKEGYFLVVSPRVASPPECDRLVAWLREASGAPGPA